MPRRALSGLILAAALLPAASAAAERKDWTIMLFVNGKNDLEPFALADVNEMEAVGSSDRVNVVVELGRSKGHDASDGNWTGARRYLIGRDADPRRISSPVLAELPQADMGDWHHLAEFVSWAKERFPARRTMLVVWNHGNGWYLAPPGFSAKAISHDQETGHQISTVQLGRALAASAKLDIYASDACLMQLAEVAYEVRGGADYVLGSEDLEPSDGFPYIPFLKAATADPSLSPAALGTALVDAHAAHYEPRGMDSTLSLVRADALPGLYSRLDDWTRAVVSAGEPEAVRSAHRQALRFCNGNFCFNADLHHFVGLVAAGSRSPDVARASRTLLDYIDRDLVVRSRATARDGLARGLAVYLPNYYYDEDYDRLAWSRDGAWADFAKWSLQLVKPPF